MQRVVWRPFSDAVSDAEGCNSSNVLGSSKPGQMGNHLAGVDARFITDHDISKASEGRSEQSFAGSMSPHRPEDWQQLLAEAGVAYDKRSGPRRLAEVKRQKLRQLVVQQQHKAAKGQKYVAHMQRQQKLRAVLLGVR